MKKEVVEGFVKGVEPYSEISFVNLIPIEGGEWSLPVYGYLGRGFLGKFVTITSEKKEIKNQGKSLIQKIIHSSGECSITIPVPEMDDRLRFYGKIKARERRI